MWVIDARISDVEKRCHLRGTGDVRTPTLSARVKVDYRGDTSDFGMRPSPFTDPTLWMWC